METVNVNLDHLSKIKKAFPGLDQDKKEITISFTLCDFAQIHFMSNALLEVADNIALNSSQDTAFHDLDLVRQLTVISRNLNKFEVYEFLDDLLLPFNTDNTKPINQK